MHRRAFSLIELVVVVSIIAVLAGVLLPTIAMVKGSALATSCASRVRQVGMAYFTYASDHDMCLPNTAGSYALEADPAKFDEYIPSTDPAWRCTDARLAKTMRLFQNWWLLDGNITQIYPGKHVICFAMLKRSSDTFMVADLNTSSSGGYHRGYANIAFADGHVTTRTDSSLVSPTPAWVWMDPGPSIKTEHIYHPGSGIYAGKWKGFTY